MKNFFTLLVVLMFSASIFAEDVVYLKNGNIYRGTIIENVEDDYLRIRLNDGGIFSCYYNDIEKITNEEKQNNIYVRTKRKETGTKLFKSLPTPGYRGFIDVSHSIPIGEWGLSRTGFSTSHGYQICPYFFAGVGVGLNIYERWNPDNNWINHVHTMGDGDPMSLPLFLHLRSEFIKSWISPYIDAKVGYSFVDKAGLYAVATIGARIALKINGNEVGFSLGAGFDFQRIHDVHYMKYFDYFINIGSVNTNAIQIRLGVDI